MYTLSCYFSYTFDYKDFIKSLLGTDIQWYLLGFCSFCAILNICVLFPGLLLLLLWKMLASTPEATSIKEQMLSIDDCSFRNMLYVSFYLVTTHEMPYWQKLKWVLNQCKWEHFAIIDTYSLILSSLFGLICSWHEKVLNVQNDNIKSSFEKEVQTYHMICCLKFSWDRISGMVVRYYFGPRVYPKGSLVIALFRPCVRVSVFKYLRDCSLVFSSFLHEVRAP